VNTENEKPETGLASQAKKILSIFHATRVIAIWSLLGLLSLIISFALEYWKHQVVQEVNPQLFDLAAQFLGLVAYLFRDIGIVFLIAGVATFVIERLHKEAIHEQLYEEVKSFRDSAEEHIKLVGSNFIHAAYGKSMPPELFNVVEESIFKADFIRSSIVIWVELNDLSECYLNVIQGDIQKIFKPFLEYLENCKNLQNGDLSTMCIEELVAVRTSLSYKVRNVSGRSLPFPVSLEVDVPYAGCTPDKLGVKPISVRVNNTEHIAEVVENLAETEHPDLTKIIFQWKPVEVKPDDVIDIQILLYSIRRKRDQEMWSFRDPCKGIEIGVEDCNGDKEIYLELMVPEFLLKETSAQKNSKTNMAWLKTETFLLPYQGVKIKWKPKVDICPIAKINS